MTAGSLRVRVDRWVLALQFVSTVIAMVVLAAPAAQAAAAFRQIRYATPQTAQASVSATFSSAQLAGSLNVVVVGWNDATAHVNTVRDSAGNSYVLAVGPTVRAGAAPLSQSIYYAANIVASAAGANAVTVTFDVPAAPVDLRIAEYTGVATGSPLEAVAASSGSSTAPNSGALTVATAGDLLVAANMVQTATTGAGTGFTLRVNTVPDSDILEDRVLTATGSYSGTATVAPAGAWVMQMVAFRPQPAGPDTQPPTATTGLTTSVVSSSQINLSWAAATDNVAVTSYQVERCAGTGCTVFAQVGTATTLTFNNTGLAASTPYGFRVRATDAAGNLGGYSNVASATTNAAPDTQAPTAPTGLGAVATSTTQISLSWAVATDNVAVTGYLVERCSGTGCAGFVQVGAATTATFGDSGLTASTAYSYRVRATDAAGNLGGYSNAASATTNAAPDTQAPTAPTGLNAAATSTTQISLSWAAATDNVAVTSYLVERCAGTGCSVFAQVGTATTLTFNDSGLAASTPFSYQVRATDAAGNLGGYSNVASATTQAPDTQAPTAPTGLTTNVVSSSQVNLSWAAATDNVAVTSYLVERCTGAGCSAFAQVGTATTLTFSNTGLAASTPYGYRVRATDAAGNLGAYSNTASATTTSQPAAPPAFVQRNYATPQSSLSAVTAAFTLAQTAGDVNVVLVGWNDGTANLQSVTDSRGNSYQLAAGPTRIAGTATQAVYYASNIAAAAAGANTVTATFNSAAAYVDLRIAEYSGVDTANPVEVTAAASGTSTTPSAGPLSIVSTNAMIVAGNMVQTATTGAGTGFTNRVITVPDGDILEDRAITAAGSYAATATISPSGWWIMQAVVLRAGTAAPPDTQAPTAPTGLTTSAVSSSQINLSWAAATDNVAVTAYQVERCTGASCSVFVQIGTATTLSFNNTGLAAATPYSYRVRATDAAGNPGAYSNTGSATTNAAPDTQAPTAPTGLAASVISPTQIGLSWAAAIDNVAVTSYLVERCTGVGCTVFAQVGSATTLNFDNTGLVASTPYSYRVRATDTAGNLGGYSNTASATTSSVPDTQAPTAPTALSAVAVSATQISLSWTAATDNVAVTSYLVERCAGGAGCAVFAQVGTATTLAFGDSGLPASTSYSYQVRATDAAGNLGGYTNVASATTNAQSTVIPAFVQINYATPQNSLSAVSAAYVQAQTYGNVNVVAVGWNDATAAVQSVNDSRGNTYRLAAGPTQIAGTATQAMYYASNIGAAGAGANTVTVAFNRAATHVDLRIAEYSGIDNFETIIGGAEATGNSGRSDSGPFTTTFPTSMIVGASMVQTATSGAGSGFTTRVITVPTSDIFEDSLVMTTGPFSAAANLEVPGWWIMQAIALKSGTVIPPDTAPPSVSFTTPSPGATLTGSVTLNVSATDLLSGVAGVQFQVDGVNVGPPITGPPYSFTLNTSQFANGTHLIMAYAWDGAGNVSVVVTQSVEFANSGAGDPAATGLWSGLLNWPLVSVHASLMHDGNVLVSDGQFFAGQDAKIWSPVTGTFVDVPIGDNIFCNGMTAMADGRILVAGGHAGVHTGINDVNIFNPSTRTWSSAAPMAYARWYPTTTLLADGRILAMAGEINCNGCIADIPEIYNPSADTWTELPQASLSLPYYPYMYQLPDGRVFAAGTAEDPITSRVLNVGTQTWGTVDNRVLDGGSAVMYSPGKILKSGSGADADDPPPSSARSAYAIDMSQINPTWRTIQSMAFARTYHTLTVLPDGNVLATGGNASALPKDVNSAAPAAELWSPITETWSTLASMHTARLYHSTAMLLPDARVLISGGGRWDDTPMPTDQLSAEIFAPPYLFKGARPTIGSAPATTGYAQSFTVQTADAAQIASVVLIPPAAVTHTNNMNQRFVPLSFTAGSGTLNITAPADANLAPPGYYMMFLVNTNGVPSVASWVRIQ